jgi:hypothetical protein
LFAFGFGDEEIPVEDPCLDVEVFAGAAVPARAVRGSYDDGLNSGMDEVEDAKTILWAAGIDVDVESIDFTD